MSELKTSNVISFSKAKGFVTVNPQVRVNKNKYPYLTFLNGKGEGENVYFSKAASAKVTEGQYISKEEFKAMIVAECSNEAGEQRHKLSFSSYVSIEDMFA